LEKFTAETLFNGELRLFQPERGYRYTIDPLLLCNQVQPPPNSRILDIGCGCGIIPLILGFSYPDTAITGIEIQTQLAELSQKNSVENQMEDRIHIINKNILDISPLDTDGQFDLIVSNPPYKKAKTGRLNPNHQKAVARHEIELTISTLYSKAAQLLKPMGRITLIFPADRLFDLYTAMASTPIRPEWIRFIHVSSKKNAMRAILSAVKNSKSSCRVLPPFYLHTRRGNITKEHQAIINP